MDSATVAIYYPDRAEWEDAVPFLRTEDAVAYMHRAAARVASPGHVEIYCQREPVPAPLSWVGSYIVDTQALAAAVESEALAAGQTPGHVRQMFLESGRMAAFTVYRT